MDRTFTQLSDKWTKRRYDPTTNSNDKMYITFILTTNQIKKFIQCFDDKLNKKVMCFSLTFHTFENDFKNTKQL